MFIPWTYIFFVLGNDYGTRCPPAGDHTRGASAFRVMYHYAPVSTFDVECPDTIKELTSQELLQGLSGWGIHRDDNRKLVLLWGSVTRSEHFDRYFADGIPIPPDLLLDYINQTTSKTIGSISYPNVLSVDTPEFAAAVP